jgi:hypothetical protein
VRIQITEDKKKNRYKILRPDVRKLSREKVTGRQHNLLVLGVELLETVHEGQGGFRVPPLFLLLFFCFVVSEGPRGDVYKPC